MKKIIFIFLLLVVACVILRLPDYTENDFKSVVAVNMLDQLPDVDLRSLAEQEWDAGRKESAVNILDYIIESNLPDSPSAQALKGKYLNQIQFDNSPAGRLRAAGYGFLTGKADDLASLAGSAAADFVIYGDLRDLTRELFFEDQADPLIVTLSTAGIVTTIFPPGEAAITVMKALKKVSALSEPMIKFLRTMLKGFKSLGEFAKVEKIKDFFIPFYELFKKAGTWSRFVTITKYCQNVDQVKMISKLISMAPDNAAKMSRIMAVAGSHGMEVTTKVIDNLANYGQIGMNSFYAALRKGPAGLKFVAEHPTLVSRFLKNSTKATPIIVTAVTNKWLEFARTNQRLAVILKYGIAIICFCLSILMILPFFNPTRKNNETELPNRSIKKILGAIVFVALVLSFYIVFNKNNENEREDFSSSMSMQQGSTLQSSFLFQEKASPVIAIVLVANIILQGYSIHLAKSRLSKIFKEVSSPKVKLALINNMDIFFDLPMYIGLGMTIFAFILMSLLGSEAARLWAYLSTLIGIGCSAYMRMNYLQKAKESIIFSMEKQGK
ncbi:hypothetical protein [Solidesulfovibrio alcoholivorans]|uniref:hypothetical protein n=1 Tax=Solidesulfovibrio alcoholivorans TaxID=81406 RepID=UPI000B24F116|nr:hypothetical protein [Solidesulfovibrio alcoholivorans]